MTTQDTSDLHRQVELLLPWYVNGTLSTDENQLVTDHLDECVECQRALAVCKTMQHALVNKSPTPIIPPANASTLLQQIDQDQYQKRELWPPRRYLAAAAVLVIAIASLILVSKETIDLDGNRQFETATSTGDQGSMDVVIDVAFDAETSQSERIEWLREIQTDTKVGLPIDDVVRVTVRFPVSSFEALESRRKQLEMQSLVESVEFVALQVPVIQSQ